MNITLLVFGNKAEPFISEGINRYITMLSPFLKLNIEVIAEQRNHNKLDIRGKQSEEEKLFTSRLKNGDEVFLLDEKGEEYTSAGFSRKLGLLLASGRKRLVFIAGGPYGFSESFKEKFPNKVSLSKMTFTNQMTRLIFAEQVYRAVTILRKMPYHHG